MLNNKPNLNRRRVMQTVDIQAYREAFLAEHQAELYTMCALWSLTTLFLGVVLGAQL
jgi:hypothetical protein